MTAAEFRAAIQELGLSQVGAGVFFGRTRRTGQRWASGESPIPTAVAMYLDVATGKITGRRSFTQLYKEMIGPIVRPSNRDSDDDGLS
jgi:hypothetical protein